MNGYKLTRDWFEWCKYNSEKVRPIHTALYLYAVETSNRLCWSENFGFPTDMTMHILGISNWRTYSRALNELAAFGFIQIVRKAPNGNLSAIISIVKTTELDTELDTIAKQSKVQDNGSTNVDINKPLQTIKPSTNKQERIKFTPPKLHEVEKLISDKSYNVDPDRFWNYYESNGWMVGQNKMKSWTAALGKWNADDRNNKKFNELKNSQNEQNKISVNRQTLRSAGNNSNGFG